MSDAQRLRAIRRSLEKHRGIEDVLIAERLQLWKRNSPTMTLRELGELSGVHFTFISREIGKDEQ